MEISFIMPCFNAENTIKKALDSIINIGLKKYEICAVDDCSSDSTFIILNYYKNKYPNNFIVSKNSKNRGGGYTRNKCVSLSKYPNIFCLDSDNILHKESFLKLISSSDKYLVAAFSKYIGFTNFGPFNLIYKETRFLTDVFCFEDLRKEVNNPASDGNILFKRKIFDEISGYEEFYGAADTFTFGYKILKKGYEINIIKNTFYYHRIHINSYWMKDIKKSFTFFYEFLKKNPELFIEEEFQKFKSLNPLNLKEFSDFYYKPDKKFSITKIKWPYNVLLKFYYYLKNIFNA